MPRSPAPADRRAFGRREILVHAIARVPGRPSEPCIVRDLSAGGALLEFQVDFEPSGPFRLSIEAKGIDAVCEVRRRDGRVLGVMFSTDVRTGTGGDVVLSSPPLPSDVARSRAGDDMQPTADPEPTAAVAPGRQILQLQSPILVVSGEDVRRNFMAAR